MERRDCHLVLFRKWRNDRASLLDNLVVERAMLFRVAVVQTCRNDGHRNSTRVESSTVRRCIDPNGSARPHRHTSLRKTHRKSVRKQQRALGRLARTDDGHPGSPSSSPFTHTGSGGFARSRSA